MAHARVNHARVGAVSFHQQIFGHLVARFARQRKPHLVLCQRRVASRVPIHKFRRHALHTQHAKRFSIAAKDLRHAFQARGILRGVHIRLHFSRGVHNGQAHRVCNLRAQIQCNWQGFALNHHLHLRGLHSSGAHLHGHWHFKHARTNSNLRRNFFTRDFNRGALARWLRAQYFQRLIRSVHKFEIAFEQCVRRHNSKVQSRGNGDHFGVGRRRRGRAHRFANGLGWRGSRGRLRSGGGLRQHHG